MRKVLIVSPHFPPINAPDHQRVRTALPFLEQFGWQPTILAVDPKYIDGFLEPLLQQTLPEKLKIIRTHAIASKWSRLIGIGSLSYRAMGHVRRTGEILLRDGRFDLVFISTTLFPFMKLGPSWKRQFGTPYVLDFQDPWLSDYYLTHPNQRPPGGRLKYGLSRFIAKRLEPSVVRNAGHIVCVSAAYSKTFQLRYPDVPTENFTTLPFGAPELDFSALVALKVSQSVFNPRDGLDHWVYAGRGGQDMAFAVRAFFMALKRHLVTHPEFQHRTRIHFIGTDYAPSGRARKTIEPLAREFELEKIVSEDTDRLPYLEALKCLTDANALFIPGSDDPTYTASKLYPYILARKPLLAVFNEASSVVSTLRITGAGKVVTFSVSKDLRQVADEIYDQWFKVWPLGQPATNWQAFAPYTSSEMTRRLCDAFDRAL